MGERGRYMKKRDHLGGPAMHGEIEITAELEETGPKWLEWIHVAHDRGHWRAIVYSAI